jgi:ribosomal protein S3
LFCLGKKRKIKRAFKQFDSNYSYEHIIPLSEMQHINEAHSKLMLAPRQRANGVTKEGMERRLHRSHSAKKAAEQSKPKFASISSREILSSLRWGYGVADFGSSEKNSFFERKQRSYKSYQAINALAQEKMPNMPFKSLRDRSLTSDKAISIRAYPTLLSYYFASKERVSMQSFWSSRSLRSDQRQLGGSSYSTLRPWVLSAHLAKLFRSTAWTNAALNEVYKDSSESWHQVLARYSLPQHTYKSAALPCNTLASPLTSTIYLNYYGMQYWYKYKTNGYCDVNWTLQHIKPKVIQAKYWKQSLAKSRHYSLSHIQACLSSQTKTMISIIPVKVTSVYQSAALVAQEICCKLEHNKSFRQICKTIFKQIEKCTYIKGIRISCSGRLNGAEIAKTECKKYGETSLHIFDDQIDYAYTIASTPYGICGVKVWICYL